jgi:transposase
MSTDASAPKTDSLLDLTGPLPDDPVVLQQMIRELLQQLRDAQHETEQLRHQLERLIQRLYGPRTERLDPNQLLLIPDAFEPAPADPQPVAPEIGPKPKKHQGHGRTKATKELRREHVMHELSEAERCCPECGTLRIQIGAERSEQFEYVPASLFIVEHVRCTYACPHCEGQVITADKPDKPIPKGSPGPGLIAYVVTSKYVDHIPLHRQERIFARHGLELSRSTLCDWTAACAKLLEPLYELMKSRVLQSGALHTDDTPVKAQNPKTRTIQTGRLWLYAGDHTQPLNVFDFTLNRSRDGPAQFLKGFHGYLHADAFGGYDGIYVSGDVIEVMCNAHARRKFHEARTADAARAAVALGYYRALYAIEAAIKAQIEDEADESKKAAVRLLIRTEQAVPLLEEFHKWLEKEKPEVLPKSPIGTAISYALNHWDALARYTASGFLDIDNNVAEQEMKNIAIGRKNWLFVGSENGGKTAAVLFSVASSCRRHGHDTFAYLRDVLTRLPKHPRESLEELLPDRWKPLPAAEGDSSAASVESSDTPTS